MRNSATKIICFLDCSALENCHQSHEIKVWFSFTSRKKLPAVKGSLNKPLDKPGTPLSEMNTLSYIIPWRSGSYTCFSNRSVAKNMADFGLCWRQIHAIWYLRLKVITTEQAQFWSRLNFRTLLVFCRILFCFLSFRGIKFCRFFSVFSMFSGHLTICLSICKL